ncbi:hypothetical protein TRFO_42280 [Tritrichomonas foetus]|uniref:Uncharacterized protein n=1 Tax=Tritrichomonas foetus TaxID=1144522 RepID=A0A1J4KX55_9EUKA|nr:hypothetical protein TRFO_42280 [Tritrichomonas foetus]|eukprot:OHT15815.1 hypothetical protein TRFO_42280 [Tritrichomonas foetus]
MIQINQDNTPNRSRQPITAFFSACFSAIIIIIILLSFFRYTGTLFGFFGLILMIVGTCLECWVIYVSLKIPRFARTKQILIYLSFIGLGTVIFVSILIIDKAWKSFYIATIVAEVVFVAYCIYCYLTLTKYLKNATNNDNNQQNNENNANNRQNVNNNQNDPAIYIPPDPFFETEDTIENKPYNKDSSCNEATELDQAETIPENVYGIYTENASYPSLETPIENVNVPYGVPTSPYPSNPYEDRFNGNAENRHIV